MLNGKKKENALLSGFYIIKMEVYQGVLIALLLIGISRIYGRKRVRHFQLSERKEWLRYYFVLALGADGRIVDALWHQDPWLTQGDESEEQMRAFADQYVAICKTDWHLILNATDIGYSGGGVDVWITDISLDVMLQEALLTSHHFTWNSKEYLRERRGPAWNGNDPRTISQRHLTFETWRTALLTATANFAAKKLN